ncbi:hypothetical protein Syun_001893 [Stephania yunnanensis]|uniref:Uncharacterized protein n=1 Tax=Stephania yunnanensis TaxID=152371 RepID=A0AAP0LEL9_9MAGN
MHKSEEPTPKKNQQFSFNIIQEGKNLNKIQSKNYLHNNQSFPFFLKILGCYL